MKIRISAISSEGIDAYRILRLMPDGSRTSIPSCDWQSSNVFTGMHNGGGYVFQVRDIEGNITEQEIPIEDPLTIIAYGSYIYQAAVNVTAATNIPSNIRVRWDVAVLGEEYEAPPISELDDIFWNKEFDYGHTVLLPYYYMGAVHHYWVFVRSQYNQRASANGRYSITPQVLDAIKNNLYVSTEIWKVDIDKNHNFVFTMMANPVNYKVSSESLKCNFGTEENFSKVSISKNKNESFGNFVTNLTYTVS